MRYPTIPKSTTVVRQGKVIPYGWLQFNDEFIWLDRRWSKEAKFRETYDRIAEGMSKAEEGIIFEMENKDFENYCEVVQDWPPQQTQIMPDIVRPTRAMINSFCSAPTEDPRVAKSNGEKKEEEKKPQPDA